MDHSCFDHIRIVLVNTSHPGNVGAAARAMKNMGLSRLYLVDPRDYPSPKAVWRAANAADVLDGVVVVETLADAVGDCGLVVGTSARERRIPWPLLTPRECGERSWTESASHQIAIVFGREDRGLTNEELQQCQFHVHIPANPDYSALNISAAVQVICYEIRMAYLAAEAGKPIHFEDWDMPPAKQQDLEHYYAHLQETLETLGFLEPDNPRQTMTRLRRLYGRIRLDQMELSILRGILTATQNYIFHTGNRIKKLEKE
ncbi:MAG: tRNA (cytosine(32)/uridine(32)-2'-O)-methyltransferase TrmJ [Cellvibrionaceae bacterium]